MKTLSSILLTALVAVCPMRVYAKGGAVHPDYTKGDSLETPDLYWNIGPTGVIGYFWKDRATQQILVKEVLKGSPAEGLIKEGDVLVGLGDARFTNARDELVDAIIKAEEQDGGGTIDFRVWRPSAGSGQASSGQGGKYLQVGVTVPYMGAYSKTSPYDCPKTEAIIKNAVKHILKVDLMKEQVRGEERESIVDDLMALGLLATGDKELIPAVRQYVHKVAGPEVIYERGKRGIGSWHGGYRNLLLTEYYLITKDDHILPTLKSLSEFLALGVSGMGTWSHGMAAETYGPPGAYGAMSNCSITCALSLALARKCGVETPAINKAIELHTKYLNWFIDKGTIPYGAGVPNLNSHDSNGRNSQAAVFLDIIGHRKGAEYFTRMTIASHTKRDRGHTGYFWSLIWGDLGASRGGKEAAAAFMQGTRYYTELQRRFDGSFIYQGASRNKGWDCTGERLISLCSPRKALYITGKGTSCVKPIVGEELKDVLDAGNYSLKNSIGEFAPPKLSVDELLEALGSWSPVVRRQASVELGTRKENVTEKLLAMLKSGNPYQRYGACLGLQQAGRGSKKAVSSLLETLQTSDSLTMKYYAANGLRLMGKKKKTPNGLGKEVLSAAPALLKLASNYDKSLDPYGKISQEVVHMFFLGNAFYPYDAYFKGGRGLNKLGSKDVVAAMKSWLTNPNGEARAGSSKTYSALSKEQLEQLWPEIYVAATEQALSGAGVAQQAIWNSQTLLAENQFKEALPMAVALLVEDGWGKFGRVPIAFETLSRFGSAVKPYMKFVEYEYQEYLYRDQKSKKFNVTIENYKKLKENLNKDVELKSIKPYLKAAGIPFKKFDVNEILNERARVVFGWKPLGTPVLKDRKWRYTTLSPKPGKTYDVLNKFWKDTFYDVAAGEGLGDWFKPDFDDSKWKTGPAPIGKRPWIAGGFKIPEATRWDNDDTYLLMRTTFTIDHLDYEKFRMRLADPMAVRIYINGKETFTPSRPWPGQAKYRIIGGHRVKGLVKGKNTLAIYALDAKKWQGVMADCIIEGLPLKKDFDPTPYYKEQ